MDEAQWTQGETGLIIVAQDQALNNRYYHRHIMMQCAKINEGCVTVNHRLCSISHHDTRHWQQKRTLTGAIK